MLVTLQTKKSSFQCEQILLEYFKHPKLKIPHLLNKSETSKINLALISRVIHRILFCYSNIATAKVFRVEKFRYLLFLM